LGLLPPCLMSLCSFASMAQISPTFFSM
jgi:hypothetical protein